MLRNLVYALAALFKSRSRLVAENLCLRQQLIVLKHHQVRPLLYDADRRFWVLACRWFGKWRDSLIIVKPDTVIRWHRMGWKAYWHWRSTRSRTSGRRTITPEIRELIRRMARENPLWGQRRIQAEPAKLALKDYPQDEFMYLLSGKILITDENGHLKETSYQVAFGSSTAGD